MQVNAVTLIAPFAFSFAFLGEIRLNFAEIERILLQLLLHYGLLQFCRVLYFILLGQPAA